jgi:Na+/H+ antiporter NhaC
MLVAAAIALGVVWMTIAILGEIARKMDEDGRRDQ